MITKYQCLIDPKERNKMKKYLYIYLTVISLAVNAQRPDPVPAQSQRILIMNGVAHIGNGKVIENSAIGFENGKLTLVADATVIRLDKSKFDKVIDAQGKHIYPGLIECNSTLGLTEIDMVRSTVDNFEVGDMNPNVRSLIAYNSDSRIIPTVRSNGVLLAQIVPSGGTISGQSSVVQLDAWNWEDAAYKTDEGIHLNWPRMYISKGGNAEPEEAQRTKIQRQLNDLQLYFDEAKAYSLTSVSTPAAALGADSKLTTDQNLKFESMRGLFNGTKSLYVHCDYVKEMVSAISMADKFGIRLVIVGGGDAYRITDLLKSKNVAIVLGRTHSLPPREDDDVDLQYKLPAILSKAGINYTISMDGSWQGRNLAFNAGTSAAYGLTKEEALMSITLNAAKILDISTTTGSLETGKDATLIISSGDVLDMKSNHVESAFINGREISVDNFQKQLNQTYKTKYGIKK